MKDFNITHSQFINFMFYCTVWSIVGTIIMIVETWFPLGEWMEYNFGIFGTALGVIGAWATVIGWFGWSAIGLQYIKEKWGINLF